MNFPFFKSFFKHEKNVDLTLPESLLVKALKSTAKNNNFYIFENITIYHHDNSFFLPLVLLDETRGLYLFEHKGWSYDELKKSTIHKASKQNTASHTLAFENAHDCIKRKFNELVHNDGVPIFNYLLMENLNSDEYCHLNDSFKSLLPEERIMFNDSSQEDILNKMIERVTHTLPDASSIMSTLLVQYAIIDYKKNVFLASSEQISFINSELKDFMTLVAPSGSGKTSSILLKAILEKLKNPKFNVIIIKPNHLACDILKKKLLDTIEHAIVEIDPTSIIITTPTDFINNPPKSSDLIICDDSEFYSNTFLLDIRNVRSYKYCIVVKNSNTPKEVRHFNKSYRGEQKEIIFYKANQHAKSLQIISHLLSLSNAQDILVISTNQSRDKLKEDLSNYVNAQLSILNSSQSLLNQNLNNILLATYDDINSLEARYIILMDIDTPDSRQLEYAYNLCLDSVYILYDKQSKNLELIRNNFENNKDG